MTIGPGSLKCVTAWSPSRSLRDPLGRALRRHVRADDVHHLYGDVFVVYTEADSATVRDWLVPGLHEQEPAFVVEFEKWSGYGPAPDATWLLRRGH